jgi:hypothetical protein
MWRAMNEVVCHCKLLGGVLPLPPAVPPSRVSGPTSGSPVRDAVWLVLKYGGCFTLC